MLALEGRQSTPSPHFREEETESLRDNRFDQGQTANYPGLEPKPSETQGSFLCTAVSVKHLERGSLKDSSGLPPAARPQRCCVTRRQGHGLSDLYRVSFHPRLYDPKERCGQSWLPRPPAIAGWDVKEKESPAVLPSPGSLSLPRRTRAFLAPRPFSAVAATTAAMFRSHPPSPCSPPGIVVCVRGLPRSFRPAYRPETTSPRSPRSGLRRTTLPRRPRRRARSLVSLLLGAESGRAEFGFSPPRLGPFSNSAL